MIRIGLIEDNEDFRAELRFHLARAGFAIVLEGDGGDIDAQLAHSPCDLLVLDLGLPAEDGLSIARRLRAAQPGLGIVMLTARGGLDDKLTGLAEGADAYLAKPVDMRELAAVLHSVHRRLAAAPGPDVSALGWTLKASTLTLESPDGVEIGLTATEADLLGRLAESAPESVSREALAAAMGHPELDFDYRRLEVAFSRLRRKIEAAVPECNVVRAAWGRGYLFAAPIQRISA